RILILGIGTAAKRRVLITFCGSPYPRMPLPCALQNRAQQCQSPS
ncbi:hypothetical protein HYS47_04820, partial [Candidatus Woesearchaeota archaeon]|nr:hypothetical protein [Candidatus Woesearchaeota archaeon]